MNYEIKLITVDGEFKALVLDMNKRTERLVYLASGLTKAEVETEAMEYVSFLESGAACH